MTTTTNKLLLIVSNYNNPLFKPQEWCDIMIDTVDYTDQNRMYYKTPKNYCYFLYCDVPITIDINAIREILHQKKPAILKLTPDLRIVHRSLVHYFYPTIPYCKYSKTQVQYVMEILEQPLAKYINTEHIMEIYESSKSVSSSEPIWNEEKAMHKSIEDTTKSPVLWINSAVRNTRSYIGEIDVNEKEVWQLDYLKVFNPRLYFNLDHAYFKNRRIKFKTREIYGDVGLYGFAHNYSNVSRSQIINHLIAIYGYNDYLEIGVCNCYTFNDIQCKNKTGVDPSPAFENKIYKKWAKHIVLKTSDEFYNKLSDDVMFDIIFIDGCLMSENVQRDIDNCLRHLREGGVIVYHDANPPIEFCQRDLAKRTDDNTRQPLRYFDKTYNIMSWNGKVWREFGRMRMVDEDLEVMVVDCDWGMGIIRRNSNEPISITGVNPYNLQYDDLMKYRHILLNLISVEDFLETFPVKVCV